MKPLIEVSHISKRYQHIQALEDVSFAVNQGELFGIIGPDGSGKVRFSAFSPRYCYRIKDKRILTAWI